MLAVAFLAEIEDVSGPIAWEDRLRQSLEHLGVEHRSTLVAPIVMTGHFPECAGVLSDLAAAYPIARSLAETFFPHPVRAAAAWGELPGTDSSPDLDLLDAPAFENASELLYRVRKENR